MKRTFFFNSLSLLLVLFAVAVMLRAPPAPEPESGPLPQLRLAWWPSDSDKIRILVEQDGRYRATMTHTFKEYYATVSGTLSEAELAELSRLVANATREGTSRGYLGMEVQGFDGARS